MNKIELKLILEGYDLLTQDLTQKVKKFVRDKNIPLDDRWDIFVFSQLGESDNYIVRLNSYDMDDYLEYKQRHETIDLTDFVEEYLYERLDDDDEEINSEIVNAVKEEILDLFIKEFKFDW